MNGLKFMKIRNKCCGFTLAESLVSLIVIAIGFSLINIFLEFSTDHQAHYYDSVRFYSGLNHFEGSSYQLNEAEASRLLVRDAQTHKRYQIKLKGRTLLLTGIDNRGYVPLMDQVRSVHWLYCHHLLKTQIIMTDGKQYQSNSFISSKAMIK